MTAQTQAQAIEDVLRLAIVGEQDSHDLYRGALRFVSAPESKRMLEDLASDELGHKAKLEIMLRQGITWNIAQARFTRLSDLKLGDHFVAAPLAEGADFQAVLMSAIGREKQSHELYARMAGVACDVAVHNLFLFLANEELSHKRKLETLYEEVIYKDF